MTLDHKLAELIRICSHIVQDLVDHHYIVRATDIPLSPNQYYILRILSISSPHILGDIAQVLHISNAAVGKNIEKLAHYKLVIRRSRRADRRVVKIAITDAGRSIINKYDQVRSEFRARVLSNYNEEEKLVFAELLKRFVENTLMDHGNTDLICLHCTEICDDDCIIKECKGECSFHIRVRTENED